MCRLPPKKTKNIYATILQIFEKSLICFQSASVLHHDYVEILEHAEQGHLSVLTQDACANNYSGGNKNFLE